MAKEYLQRIVFPPMGATEGEFVVVEDFEGPHLFNKTGTAGKYFAERQAIHARQGTYALGLRIETATPVIGDYVQVERNFCLGRSPYLEIEGELKLYQVTGYGKPNIDIEIQVPDLTDMTQRIACVRINTNTKKVYVRTGITTYTEIGDILDLADGDWLFIEFSVNRNTSKYGKVIINEQEFDASAHSVYSTATVDATKAYRIKATTTVAEPTTIILDRLLIRTASA